ncbi:hypothetical protein [Streptomyces bluensis]|uniref:Uncharacterized protein n=1 Tax=Streptomyces bluensis TaxID=33897 RepID=A0ABW6UV93_9ACTN
MQADRTARIRVSHHQYVLFDTDAEPPSREIDDRLAGNGLVAVNAQGTYAAVTTGTPYGDVEVTFAVSLSPPPLLLDSWDDAVEVSLFFSGQGPMAGEPTTDDVVDVPLFGEPEDHQWWRFRIHARGRNAPSPAATPTAQGTTHEQHLIQVWPAPRAAEIRHKLTDRVSAPTHTTDPHYYAQAKAVEQEHATALRQNLETRLRPVLNATLHRLRNAKEITETSPDPHEGLG